MENGRISSVGPNTYGHPSEDAIGRLDAAGSGVYTTWSDGDVVVTTDGVNWSFS